MQKIMAKPSQKLADSLEMLKALQDKGIAAIQASQLSRIHRERLQKQGFLKEVMKGWYIPTSPLDERGEVTVWYASFWDFCASYLTERFGKDWCIAPEQSLLLHAGNRTVPAQLLVRSPRGGNKPTSLLHNSSIFDMRAAMPKPEQTVELDGLRLYSPATALVEAGATVFQRQGNDARIVLAMVPDASEILSRLLEGGHSVIAGRLAGAFRNIGHDRIADDIIKSMEAAGYTIRESDPFETPLEISLPKREASPYPGRIRLLWQTMRDDIIGNFPDSPGQPDDENTYLKRVEDVYVTDAYHSLSIEGYRVSTELIERVRSGQWNPDSEEDRLHRDAMAAHGYYQAFQSVKKGIRDTLEYGNPGTVAERDHGDWYRKLFAPSVTAGILGDGDLAGYRNSQVFIRRSSHIPLPPAAVRATMPVFFELIKQEPDSAVRAVLGHFVFVYIHPYTDGNGRMARFLMNVMLAGGGYPWTVVPVERREDYMAALEHASVRQDINPFSAFLGELVGESIAGKTAAELPANSVTGPAT